ncbi:14104_t:CDS:2, partial [Funneliformis geosporum]
TQKWVRFLEAIEEVGENAEKEGVISPLKEGEKSGLYVALKSLNNSSELHKNFLDEVSFLFKFINLNENFDPKTLNYMFVLKEMKVGSLKSNLMIKKYNPNDKYGNLFHIATSLSALHGCNLFHGDFHSGNLLLQHQNRVYVSDLGLSRPSDHFNNDIFGVIPYMAPEVLRGKPYTRASDIYSFGIIMWEYTSGVPALHDVPHDLKLTLDICRGLRPKIIEDSIPNYVEIMESCWDLDPNKRPSADDLVNKFQVLMKKYPFNINRIPVPEHELVIQKHPSSCYTSRKFDHSAKLNKILSQDLSSKIIIDQEDDDDVHFVMISEDLESYMIKNLDS